VLTNNPWILAGTSALLLTFGGGVGYMARGKMESNRAAAVARAQEEAVQARIDAALSAQHDEHARLLAAAEKRAQAAEKRTARVAGLIGEIKDAPETSACASSPAVRVALNGLRQLEVDEAGSNPN
jgi:hypothetical protein